MTNPDFIEQNKHIPTAEIEQDIKDTEKELQDLKEELQILMKNPVDNRVRIYFVEGNILKHESFIADLQILLEDRNKKPQHGPESGCPIEFCPECKKVEDKLNNSN